MSFERVKALLLEEYFITRHSLEVILDLFFLSIMSSTDLAWDKWLSRIGIILCAQARMSGSFTSFAAGFSYLSILTGIFQTFHMGYGSGGPAFFWTWPAVFLGQLLVALCFAELATPSTSACVMKAWASTSMRRVAAGDSA